MTTWKIEITEPHSGELGEAILHEDHGFAFEEYTYPAGEISEVRMTLSASVNPEARESGAQSSLPACPWLPGL